MPTTDAFGSKPGRICKKPVRRPWFNRLPERLQGLAESACIAACASAATFPVLVLRGLSVSVWAMVSSIAVLWMVQPLLLLGLAVAFAGLVPWLAPVHGGALPGGRPAHRPIERLGGLALHKARGVHLL